MARPSDSYKNWLGKIADRYHNDLSSEALTYLADRGIRRKAVSGGRLGLVSNPDPMHEPFQGRLSIPFITPTGVVYMRFRCLEDHNCKEENCQKYLGPTGEPAHLYNVQALHDADITIGICEGELDALVSTNAGFPCVGVPGSHNWKPFYYRLFDDFQRVIVLGDGDKAGREFTTKLIHEIPEAEAKLIPDHQDVNEFILEHGKKTFLDFVYS